MSDYVVKAGATARLGTVEGELRVGRNAKITAESNRKVVVTKGAYFEGPVTIDCDFECQSMRVEGRGFGPGGDVAIHGSLTVLGNADIDASAAVTGTVQAGGLDVGGHFRSGQLTTKRLRVGGHLETVGKLEADEVDVGGHMTVPNEVKIVNLRVGGHARVGGGSISGTITVRGHFSTTKKLAFGRLQVFGNMLLPAGSSGEHLSALGKVEFEGDTSCKELEITGLAKARGDCSAENVDVKGKLDVSGSLCVTKRLQVWGMADIGRAVECETLGVGGKLTAKSVLATDRAEVAGEVKTNRGLKARSVVVGKASKVVGPIIAEKTDVGSDADLGSIWGLPWWQGALGRLTSVEDIHGGMVRLGGYSRAKHIYGETVVMEEGSMADWVVYTEEVRLPQKYFLAKPPVKTGKLPDPPF